MLQSHSSDGVRLYQDPGVRLVVDGQMRGSAPLGNWVGDGWDAVTDGASEIWDAAKQLVMTPEAIGAAFKGIGIKACSEITSSKLREWSNYCAAAALIPGGFTQAVGATCAAYATACSACGLVFPPVPPPVPTQGTSGTGASGTGTSTQVTQAMLLQKQNALLQMRAMAAQVAAGTRPWYKRPSTYAVLGAAAAAVGGAYYFARVRR